MAQCLEWLEPSQSPGDHSLPTNASHVSRLCARVRQKIGNRSVLYENLLHSSVSRFELKGRWCWNLCWCSNMLDLNPAREASLKHRRGNTSGQKWMWTTEEDLLYRSSQQDVTETFNALCYWRTTSVSLYIKWGHQEYRHLKVLRDYYFFPLLYLFKAEIITLSDWGEQQRQAAQRT